MRFLSDQIGFVRWCLDPLLKRAFSDFYVENTF